MVMKYKGESIENMEWVESYENFDMDVYNLVGCVCRNCHNPFPHWVFDNIMKILKKWAKMLYFEKMNK